ncbi:MAG TPA: hypothetical protein VGQ81_06275, partial [Acidobacteriota bacterium]|nr:hypothetical protein [Acidobacteriota bacterium]
KRTLDVSYRSTVTTKCTIESPLAYARGSVGDTWRVRLLTRAAQSGIHGGSACLGARLSRGYMEGPLAYARGSVGLLS